MLRAIICQAVPESGAYTGLVVTLVRLYKYIGVEDKDSP
jgi:hypothetical protein